MYDCWHPLESPQFPQPMSSTPKSLPSRQNPTPSLVASARVATKALTTHQAGNPAMTWAHAVQYYFKRLQGGRHLSMTISMQVAAATSLHCSRLEQLQHGEIIDGIPFISTHALHNAAAVMFAAPQLGMAVSRSTSLAVHGCSGAVDAAAVTDQECWRWKHSCSTVPAVGSQLQLVGGVRPLLIYSLRQNARPQMPNGALLSRCCRAASAGGSLQHGGSVQQGATMCKPCTG